MAEPIAMRWEYDQNLPESEFAFTTFSIGVYQWLPKASGKGLKKSTSIRVKGYGKEPERVFEKARELCHRLNAESVNAENLPAWVQKQYSVPKPADLVIEPLTDDLTGSQVRSVRIQVMKQHLVPVGFVKGKDGTYVRECDNQIHLIDFQPSKYGHEYTVNLGFHYSFVPPLFHRKRIKLAEFHQLDCAFHSRIGPFLADRRDVWFPYGNDREALRNRFVQNVSDCLTVFNNIANRWSNSQRWITKPVTGPEQPWRSDDFEVFVACVHIHLQQFDEAAIRLKELLNCAKYDFQKRFYSKLLDKARRKVAWQARE